MTEPNHPMEVKLADNLPGAEYANLMQVSHTKEEFLMMFANLVGQSGRVVGKIITSPGHMKRIIRALQENIQRYEKIFGNVEEAEAPSEIGFGDRK